MFVRSIALLALFVLASCGDAGPEGPSRSKRDVPHVYTTFYPTAYFAERIGGDKVKVISLLPDDGDPIFWKPSPEIVAKLQDDADLILVNGARLEKWLETVSLPRARVVDTARGFKEQWLHFDTGVTHTHGDGASHTHEGVDGHTWVDPLLALKQAQKIKDALSLGWPQHAEHFQAGFDELASDLRALDEAFAGLGVLPAGQSLYTTHAAYSYLARRHGWRLVDLNLTQEPTESELAEIAAQRETHPGRYLLWERTPDAQTARVFKGAVGLQSVLVSPCETRSGAEAAGGDYLAAMRANVERLRPAFTP